MFTHILQPLVTSYDDASASDTILKYMDVKDRCYITTAGTLQTIHVVHKNLSP